VTHSVDRLKIVYICLMSITLASLCLTSHAVHNWLSLRGVTSIAAVIAFIKARYVMLEFMELRGTSMQLAFDLWLFIVGVSSIALALR
jgi:hypothetical protein